MIGAPASPPDPFNLTGEILDRKYRVDRLIAEGGFGVVYAGWHLGLDSPIAIKVLKRASTDASEDWTDRLLQFLDEAKTLAKLRHPNIVAVLDAGTRPSEEDDAGLPWMVLEWLEGKTLREDLESRRRMGGRSPADCLALLKPVLEAIGDAHAEGVVHRDLKPSNIMLTPRWGGVTARVLDFGIAKMLSGHERARGDASGNTATATRVSSFTLASAAPEQLSGSRTGPWTDVYALALLLTEMLADRPPYPPHDPHEHYQLVFHTDRPSPRSLGVDVGAWEAVLTRALSVRPAERHANARELLADLERELPRASSAPIASSEDADTERALSQSRTRTTSLRPTAGWTGWAVAAGAAVIVAGIAVFRRGAPAHEAAVPVVSAVANAMAPSADAGAPMALGIDASAPSGSAPASASAPASVANRRYGPRGAAVPSSETHVAPAASVSASASNAAPSRDTPGIIERSPY